MSAGGASAASAAAAAAELQRRMEEEEMTPYSSDDLNQPWEFKIIRSAIGAFRKPERLRQILNEEAEAGWELVEKFDNTRIRLKRPVSAREQDPHLPFDAYRTNVGASDGVVALSILGAVLLGILGLTLAMILAN